MNFVNKSKINTHCSLYKNTTNNSTHKKINTITEMIHRSEFDGYRTCTVMSQFKT